MSKRFLFPLLALLLLLGGCRSEKYVTALEAYERIRPVMLSWHEDAVVLYASCTPADPSIPTESAEQYVLANGRSRLWLFGIASPSALKATAVVYIDGEITLEPDDPVFPALLPALPIGEIIDTDRAATIARRAGVAADYTLYGIGIDYRYEVRSDTYIQPVWDMSYYRIDDVSQQRQVFVDVMTGEVLRNDFADQSEKYATALEAYEQARPITLAWREDAVVLDIYAGCAERSNCGVHTDGTARFWIFTIASASASKETEVWLKDGRVVRVGMEILNGEAPYSPIDTSTEPPNILLVDEMLDSDEAAEIALGAGATMSDTLYEMRITRYDECCDGFGCGYISPAWVLTYGTDPYDFDQQQVVLIDVVTGEVLCNEFSPQNTPADAGDEEIIK